jgi:hypothetical protein
MLQQKTCRTECGQIGGLSQGRATAVIAGKWLDRDYPAATLRPMRRKLRGRIKKRRSRGQETPPQEPISTNKVSRAYAAIRPLGGFGFVRFSGRAQKNGRPGRGILPLYDQTPIAPLDCIGFRLYRT